jgi:hypothetical protein
MFLVMPQARKKVATGNGTWRTAGAAGLFFAEWGVREENIF